MENEYITLPTAESAKEVGFDWYVGHCYTKYIKTHKSDNPSFAMKKGEVEFESTYFKNNSTGDLTCKNYIQYAAPSKATLQRWLREVKHIDVIVYPVELFNNGNPVECDELEYTFWIIERGVKKPFYTLAKDIAESYEQALEIGLTKALSLLKEKTK